MWLFDLFFQWITIYPGLTITAITFLFGDETVYFFSFLSGQGLIPLWKVIFFSLIGNGSCDIFWFYVARIPYLKFIKNKLRKKSLDNSEIKVSGHPSFSGKKIFFTLIMSKFFYGTRLVTIFYIARKEKSFKRIIIYNTLAVLSWLLVVAPVLWIIGKITSISFNTIKNAHEIISLGVVIMLVVYFFNIIVIKRIIEKVRNKKQRIY